MTAFGNLNKVLKPYGCKSLATIYDAIEIEVPRKHAAEVLELCFRYLDDWPVEHFNWLELPIGVEAEIGFSWGNCNVFHRGSTQKEIEEKLGVTT